MTPTETGPPATNRLSKRRRHRRLLVGSVVGGAGVSLLLREVLGYPVLAEAAYWLGILGFLGVLLGTSETLFDERDRQLERRASQLTLTAFAVVLVVGASAARTLPRVSDYVVPDAVWPALYAYASLYVAFAVAYGWVRYGR